MNPKALNTLLAHAIQAGIDKFQTSIQKNGEKEQKGMDKLQKALGGDDPALTGAGTDLSAGSATVGVPNLMRGEVKGAEVNHNYQPSTPEKGTPINAPFRSKQISAAKKNKRAEYEASKVEKGALPEGGGQGTQVPQVAPPSPTQGKNGTLPMWYVKRALGQHQNALNLLNGKQPVKKGVLPEGEGAGTPGGVSDMSNNLDAGFGKGEMDSESGCPACGGQREMLGVLGNTVHLICRGCHMHSMTPVEENTEAKEGAEPNVEKAEKMVYATGEGPRKIADKTWHVPGVASINAARKKNMVAESKASQVEKAEKMVYATGEGPRKIADKTWHVPGVASINAARKKNMVAESKASQVEKAEADAKDMVNKGKGTEYGTKDRKETSNPANGSAVAKPMKKEEITPRKEVPMTATVVAEKVKGAKDGTEKIPEAKNHDGSGEVTKGKSLEKGSLPMVPGKGVANRNKYLAFMYLSKFNPKTADINPTGEKTVQTLMSPEPKPLHPADVAKGAMVDHIKAQAKKANVPVKDVLGSRPPKTLETSLPPPSPKFNKAGLPMHGVAREVSVKNNNLALPSDSKFSYPRYRGGDSPNLPKGGVQSQIAAVKKPLVPMVNRGGPVAKGEIKTGENFVSPKLGPKAGAWMGGKFVTNASSKKAASNNKVAESKAQEVEKAEYRDAVKSRWEAIAEGKANQPNVSKPHNSGKEPVKTGKVKHEPIKRVYPKEVTKAEPTMAKPVTKSPSSAPAGKVSAPKPPAAVKTIAKL